MAKVKKARRAKAATRTQARRRGGQLARKAAPKRAGNRSDASRSRRGTKVLATVVGVAALAAAGIQALNRKAEPPAWTPRPPAPASGKGRARKSRG
jgi:hypothetical protein